MKARRLFLVALLPAISLSSCAGRTPAPDRPDPAELAALAPGWSEDGIASWYGEPFHGRATASGEIYDMDRMTAAHRWLPFGTVVRVENLASGRSTQVRINDRGPFVRGRIIDVSRAAASDLGMVGPGTAEVRIVIEETPAEPDCLWLQVGAFTGGGNAREARERVEDAGYEARERTGRDGLRRVLTGPFVDLESAADPRRHLGGFLRACEGTEAGPRNPDRSAGL